MASFVNESAAIFVNGNKITGVTKITLDLECDMVEVTVHQSSGSREYAPGLISSKLALEGWANDAIENNYFNNAVSQSTNVITIFPLSFTESSSAGKSYTLVGDAGKITVGGTIGEIEAITVEMPLDYPCVNNVYSACSVITTTGFNYVYGCDFTDYGVLGNGASLAFQIYQNLSSSFIALLLCSSSSGAAIGTSLATKATTGQGCYQDNLVYGAGSWAVERRFLYYGTYTSTPTAKIITTVGVIK